MKLFENNSSKSPLEPADLFPAAEPKDPLAVGAEIPTSASAGLRV